jgi:hypothetical protein
MEVDASAPMQGSPAGQRAQGLSRLATCRRELESAQTWEPRAAAAAQLKLEAQGVIELRDSFAAASALVNDRNSFGDLAQASQRALVTLAQELATPGRRANDELITVLKRLHTSLGTNDATRARQAQEAAAQAPGPPALTASDRARLKAQGLLNVWKLEIPRKNIRDFSPAVQANIREITNAGRQTRSPLPGNHPEWLAYERRGA